jgi:ribosomal protein S18 acetylase RimI-like enzyme
MGYRIESASSVGLQQSQELFNRGFSDYIIPTQLDDASWVSFIVHEGIDTNASQVLLMGSKQIGIALISRRGWSSRIAAMSIVPEARGAGAGRWLMEQLIGQAHDRGERTMVLEVIEANLPALHLYQNMGFMPVRRLFGYEASGLIPGSSTLEEIDPARVARLVTMFGLDDLPWQLSGESLVQDGRPVIGYQAGEAYAQVLATGQDRVVLRALIVPPAARRQGHAGRLLAALAARYPERLWFVPALCPEELDGWFSDHGFTRSDLSQRQLILDLSAKPPLPAGDI